MVHINVLGLSNVQKCPLITFFLLSVIKVSCVFNHYLETQNR